MIGLGLGAIGVLGAAALASFRHQSLLAVEDLNLDRLGSLKETPPADLVAALCRDHLVMVYLRRTANVYPAAKYQLTLLLAILAVLVIGAELTMALAARIS
jgi:hypothetical protein